MPALPGQDLDHILQHTRADWDWLRGERLFLTGASGFFGSWLLESYLHVRDHLGLEGELHALVRDPQAFRAHFPHLAQHPGLRLVQGDQASFPFPHGPFRAVIHAAVSYGTPEQLLMDNLGGFHRVLRFAAAAGAGRVLFTSSGAVYGPQPAELPRLPESYPGGPSPLDPNQAYGEMKRACELLGSALAARHGFQFLVARCFAFLGPRMPLGDASAMGCLLRNALDGKALRLRSDGSSIRSYLHAADLSVWLWGILARGVPGTPYNVGSATGLPLTEVARRVRDLLGPGQPVSFQGEPEPGNPRRIYVPDTARAARELGLEARIGFDEAVLRTGRWLGQLGAGPTAQPQGASPGPGESR